MKTRKMTLFLLVILFCVTTVFFSTGAAGAKLKKWERKKIELEKDLYYYPRELHENDESIDKHSLDIYYPENSKDRPVMVFIHGGSWSYGDRSWYRLLGYTFAKQGIVTVIISYRLAPDYIYPAQIEDTVHAVNYVFNNISKYGGNPEFIYLCGHSAGAHIVSSIIFNDKFREQLSFEHQKLNGLILISGPFLISEEFIVKEKYSKTVEKVFTENKEVWDDASPFNHVKKIDIPIFIAYAENDWLLAKFQSKIFQKKLIDSGCNSEIKEIKTKNHYSEIVFMQLPEDEMHKEVLNFINTHLKSGE